MQPHEQAQFLRAVGIFVSDQVRLVTEPLLDRIGILEEKLKEAQAFPPLIADDVEKIIEAAILEHKNLGFLVDFEDMVSKCERMIHEAIENIPMPLPQDGSPGKDADPVDYKQINETIIETVKTLLRDEVEKIPVQQGPPGKDADPIDADALAAQMVGRVLNYLEENRHWVPELPQSVTVKNSVIDREGNLILVMTDGNSQNVGRVVGQNGRDADTDALVQTVKDAIAEIPIPKDGQDGKDGLGFDDLCAAIENERELVLTFIRGEQKKEILRRQLPFLIYRGVFKFGSPYQQGDVVTHEGSAWVAIENGVMATPGTKDSGWKLAVKHGRDGKDAIGKEGKPGKPGRDGRDLTQIGPDGSKW